MLVYSLEPSSVTIPSPSALFCLSNAFKSRTLRKETQMSNSEVKKKKHTLSIPFHSRVPARLHQSREALEKACISFLFQIIKHFLRHEDRIQSYRSIQVVLDHRKKKKNTRDAVLETDLLNLHIASI